MKPLKPFPKKLVGGLVGLGVPILRKAIKSRAHFDIAELEPLAVVSKCSPPVLFIQGICAQPFISEQEDLVEMTSFHPRER